MTGKKDLTLVVLRQIRDEIRGLGKRIDTTNERLDATREELSKRIDATNERLGHVEAGLLDLAQQQRFVVKHLQGLTSRDRRLEHEISALRERVSAIELRLDSE